MGIYEWFTIPGIMLTLHVDGGTTSIKVDNCFISMPEVMEVVACSTFLSYPSSKSLPSSGHSRDNSHGRVRIPHYDTRISGGPVDNSSTCRISILGRLTLKSWNRTSTNYPWTPSYSAPLPYVPLPRPIYSYLNLKYEKRINNYSP